MIINAFGAMILKSLEEDGIETIPGQWLSHNLTAVLKNTLGAQQPNYRGGEDLPDLLDGEVEVVCASFKRTRTSQNLSANCFPVPLISSVISMVKSMRFSNCWISLTTTNMAITRMVGVWYL